MLCNINVQNITEKKVPLGYTDSEPDFHSPSLSSEVNMFQALKVKYVVNAIWCWL